MITLPLAKAFDESKHKRDDDGRFAPKGGADGADANPRRFGGANGAPSFRFASLRELSPGPERRSYTRGEAWQRMGAKLSGLPVAYTGSREKEKPVGSFLERKVVEQIPKGVTVEQHQALFRQLKDIVRGDRGAAIERAGLMFRSQPTLAQQRDKRLPQPKFRVKNQSPLDTPLVPAGTTRGALNAAYNHAALAALHDHGIIDASQFRMDDTLKAEMKPLEPYMRFIRRRLGAQFHEKAKGSWKPYRDEFGVTFADMRRNKITGEVRRRTRPLQELVKRDPRQACLMEQHDMACRIIAACTGKDPRGSVRNEVPEYVRRTLPLAQHILETIGTGGKV